MMQRYPGERLMRAVEAHGIRNLVDYVREQNMDEKTICADIETQAHLLNESLKRAHEIGLKVRMFGSAVTEPKQIQFQVWRESFLVNMVPEQSKMVLLPQNLTDGSTR